MIKNSCLRGSPAESDISALNVTDEGTSRSKPAAGNGGRPLRVKRSLSSVKGTNRFREI